MARIIFESALLESGYPLENPKAYNERIYDLLARSVNVKVDSVQQPGFDNSFDQVRQRLRSGPKLSQAFQSPSSCFCA